MKTGESITRPLHSHHVSSAVRNQAVQQSGRARLLRDRDRSPPSSSLFPIPLAISSQPNEPSNFESTELSEEKGGGRKEIDGSLSAPQYRVNFKISMFPYTTIFSHAAGFKLVWLLPTGSEITRFVRSVNDVHQAAEIVYER